MTENYTYRLSTRLSTEETLVRQSFQSALIDGRRRANDLTTEGEVTLQVIDRYGDAIHEEIR